MRLRQKSKCSKTELIGAVVISKYSASAKQKRMHPLLKLPGFVIILIVGIAIIGYGLTLHDLDPNWVITIGIIFVIISILSITVVR